MGKYVSICRQGAMGYMVSPGMHSFKPLAADIFTFFSALQKTDETYTDTGERMGGILAL